MTTDAEHRHGLDLKLVCNQCGTSWPFTPRVGPDRCPDCLDHLGELIDPAHPDWCMRDRGCCSTAGHDGPCDLTAAL
jgi:hypothetical protein